MIVSAIAAVAENGVIGKNNELIWSLPADMAFFKKITMGHHVLMGRKSYESIPSKFRPLQGRTNVVVTRNPAFPERNIQICHKVEDGINFAKDRGENELFVIGGAQIYQYVLERNLCDRLYITHVHQKFEGHAHFPQVDLSQWEKKVIAEYSKDEKHNFAFSICEYNKA